MCKLELGCGKVPNDGYTHHDRIQHEPFVDLAWDLRKLPWPFVPATRDGQPTVQLLDVVDPTLVSETVLPFAFLDEILALDVFEHVFFEIRPWLNECWRLLKPGGLLDIRLPNAANPLSWRDPTHLRFGYDPETFSYFDPDSDLWKFYGSIYYAEDERWWKVESVTVQNRDWRYRLRKRPLESSPPVPPSEPLSPDS